MEEFEQIAETSRQSIRPDRAYMQPPVTIGNGELDEDAEPSSGDATHSAPVDTSMIGADEAFGAATEPAPEETPPTTPAPERFAPLSAKVAGQIAVVTEQPQPERSVAEWPATSVPEKPASPVLGQAYSDGEARQAVELFTHHVAEDGTAPKDRPTIGVIAEQQPDGKQPVVTKLVIDDTRANDVLGWLFATEEQDRLVSTVQAGGDPLFPDVRNDELAAEFSARADSTRAAADIIQAVSGEGGHLVLKDEAARTVYAGVMRGMGIEAHRLNREAFPLGSIRAGSYLRRTLDSIENITVPPPSETADSAEPINSPLKALARQNIRFHFVECDHAPEVAEQIGAALDGCKTAVFEAAGHTPERRIELEAKLNTLLQPDLSEATRTAITAELRASGMEYIATAIPHLPPSVEVVKTFDIDKDHPGYAPTKQAALRHRELLLELATQSSVPIVRDALQRLVTSLASSSIIREGVMARQLHAMALAEAANGPQAVGVVTGAGHAGTRQQVTADGFSCTATPWLRVPDPELRAPTLHVHLVRQLIQNPTAPLDPVALDRATLELLTHFHGFNADEALALAQNLPPHAIPPLLQQIDSIKRASGIRPVGVDPAVQDALADAWDAHIGSSDEQDKLR